MMTPSSRSCRLPGLGLGLGLGLVPVRQMSSRRTLGGLPVPLEPARTRKHGTITHAHARSRPGAVAARTHEGLVARPVMLAGAIWRTRWARALAVDGNPPNQPAPATRPGNPTRQPAEAIAYAHSRGTTRACFVTPHRAASCAAGRCTGRAPGAVAWTAARSAASAPTGFATSSAACAAPRVGGRPGRGHPPAQRRSGPHQEEVTSGQRHALPCRSRGA